LKHAIDERDEARRFLAAETAANVRHGERNREALDLLGITYPGLCTDKVWGGGIIEGIEELKRENGEARALADVRGREVTRLTEELAMVLVARDEKSMLRKLLAEACAELDDTGGEFAARRASDIRKEAGIDE
jgi:hypothetical protein